MSCYPACEACLASAALAFLPRFTRLSKGARQVCWPTTSRSFFARRSRTRAKQLGQPEQRSVGSNGAGTHPAACILAGCDRLCNFDEWLRRALFPGTWSCRICLLDQKTVRLETGERIQMSRTVVLPDLLIRPDSDDILLLADSLDVRGFATSLSG